MSWLTDSAYAAEAEAAGEADSAQLQMQPAYEGKKRPTKDVLLSLDDFAKGSWSLNLYGSATLGDPDGEVYLGHASVSYYFLDGLAISAGLVGGQIDSDELRGDDGHIIGAELLLRWHFWREADWSVYVDGGIGFTWSEHPFPAAGTHQNYNPQLGFGFTYDLCDNARLMAGARWHHISNANREGGDENPGFDGAMVYAGLMIPF